MKRTFFAICLWAILGIIALLLCGCRQALSAGLADDPENEIPIADRTDELSIEEEPLLPTDEQREEQEGILSIPPEEEPPQEETPVAAEEPYTYLSPASDLAPYLAACARANVNVRGGAGTDHKVLFTLGIGDSLPYLWREDEWIAVWTGERVGFVHASYVFLAETNLTVERVIRAGLKKVGTPYQWGATRVLDGAGEPNPAFTGKSFDCSSFVQYCFYVGAGIKLGSYTGSQADYTVGKKIYSHAELKRGDFYFTGSGTISHVVIFLGGGKLLQTYSANGGPVSVTDDDRWKAKFLSGRRPDLTVTRQFG